MGSLEEESPLVPSVSCAELLHDDASTRAQAASNLTQALKSYGACRIREHGIPQDIIDNCFEKSKTFFNRPPELKAADSRSIPKARYVPFASEKIRGETNLDETLEFQYGTYDSSASTPGPAHELLDSSRVLHEECNRIHTTLLNSLSSSMNLPYPLTSIHSPRNSFFAPYFYYFPDSEDKDTLRVPPHIDPTTLLFNFQDGHGGLKVADISRLTGKLSSRAVSEAATFVPVACQPREFVVLAGNILRKLVGEEMKHSVHCVERPVGSSGFHLNYWTVPDLDTACDFAGRGENVAEYLARVFPAGFGNI